MQYQKTISIKIFIFQNLSLMQQFLFPQQNLQMKLSETLDRLQALEHELAALKEKQVQTAIQ